MGTASCTMQGGQAGASPDIEGQCTRWGRQPCARFLGNVVGGLTYGALDEDGAFTQAQSAFLSHLFAVILLCV